ncbi:YdbH domain-containing protein [Fodinicurvata sp. EGI_FJ10296]|uniref:intermembrane phospholipid transport protein YdbH family protein n=1 Tax=Fodinicurvata sp. EGI_FJ10296 TaxID=3231908 RepID=UPI00345172BB
MMRLLRRILGLLILVALLVSGAMVAAIVAVQSPWGADRVAAVLRGWGHPINRFRVETAGWNRLVLTGISADDGRHSIDRLEMVVEGSWFHALAPWLDRDGGQGAAVAELAEISVRGLRTEAEVAADGTFQIPGFEHLEFGGESDDGASGPAFRVDALTLEDAHLTLDTPVGRFGFDAAMNGAMRSDGLSGSADGRVSYAGFGERFTGQTDVDVRFTQDAEGRFVLSLSGNQLELTDSAIGDADRVSAFVSPTVVSDGSFWLVAETTASFAPSRVAFRAESGPVKPGSGESALNAILSGEITGDGARFSIDVEAFADDEGAGMPRPEADDRGISAWFSAEARLRAATAARLMAGGTADSTADLPASDEFIDVAFDGAIADAAATRRLIVGMMQSADFAFLDPLTTDLTAALRADLVLNGQILASLAESPASVSWQPSGIVDLAAGIVVDGLVGIDAGSPLSLPDSRISAQESLRGTFRVRPTAEGLRFTVDETTTFAGDLGMGPVVATIAPDSVLSVQRGPDGLDLAGHVYFAATIGGTTVRGGEEGLSFTIVPASAAGSSASADLREEPNGAWATYTLLAPSLTIDVADFIEASAGGLGVDVDPVRIAVGGQGRLDRPSFRATIQSSARLDRNELMAGVNAAATVDVSADLHSGVVSIDQDGCATISFGDFVVPDGVRLAAPVELCIEIDSPDGRLTLRPDFGYWPREALRFRVGPGEIGLIGGSDGNPLGTLTWPEIGLALGEGAGDEPLDEGRQRPATFSASLSDGALDLGQGLGTINGASLTVQATGRDVEATLTGGWRTRVLGPQQLYNVRASLFSADGGRGEIRLVGPAGLPVLTATGTYDEASGAVVADWRIDPIDLSRIEDLSALVPALGSVAISEQRGVVSARGRAAWDDGISASGSLSIADLGFATPFGSLSGLNTTLQIRRLLPLSIPGGQQVSIDTVDLGFVLENGTFDLGISGQTVSIDDLRFAWAGGVVRAEPVVTRPSDRERTLTLEVESVRLADLFSDVPVDEFFINGTVSGRIPLRLTNDTVYIDHGILTSDAPGQMRYEGAPDDVASSGDGGMDILYRALEDFRYSQLIMTLNGQTGYNLELGLTIEGANPDLYDGYPVRLNVGVSGALDEMLRRGLETTRIGREAEELLREFDGEMNEDELIRRLQELER